MYVWADGFYLQARLEDEKQRVLVLIGATPEGRKELIGFIDGARESALEWRDLLLDLKRRGLNGRPELAIADGALSFWKAAGEIWPTTREQLLDAQDRERARQAAEEPTAEGQTGPAGDLDGRDEG